MMTYVTLSLCEIESDLRKVLQNLRFFFSKQKSQFNIFFRIGILIKSFQQTDSCHVFVSVFTIQMCRFEKC